MCYQQVEGTTLFSGGISWLLLLPWDAHHYFSFAQPGKANSQSGLSPHDIEQLAKAAINGATEDLKSAAVNRLSEALRTEQAARQRAEEELRRAQLQRMFPYMTSNPSPPTAGPGGEGWSEFCAWELEQTFQRFPNYQCLPGQRDELQRHIDAISHDQLLRAQWPPSAVKTEHISELDRRLSVLRTSLQGNLQTYRNEAQAIAGAALLAHETNTSAVQLFQHRDAALLAIGEARYKALNEMALIYIPFTELVSLHARADAFVQSVEQMSAIPDQEKILDAFQRAQAIGEPFTNPNSFLFQQLFAESPDDPLKDFRKDLKAKARLWRTALADRLNEGICKLMLKSAIFKIVQRFAPHPNFAELLREYFQLQHQIHLWNEQERLPLQPETDTALLDKVRALPTRWNGVNSKAVTDAIAAQTAGRPDSFSTVQQTSNIVLTLVEVKEASDGIVVQASLLFFSPDEKRKVAEKLKGLQGEIAQIFALVRSFPQSVQSLGKDIKVCVDALQASNNAPFAQLISRMCVLEKDIQRWQEEYEQHKNQDLLRWQFSGEDNPLSLKKRFELLEEAMYNVSTDDFKKWQAALKTVDIKKVGENLSFAMRAFAQALATGKFSYVVTQTIGETFTSQPLMYPWRGAKAV